jgi:hypothetical protein
VLRSGFVHSADLGFGGWEEPLRFAMQNLKVVHEKPGIENAWVIIMQMSLQKWEVEWLFSDTRG